MRKYHNTLQLIAHDMVSRVLGWTPESFGKMQEAARIVGLPTDDASVQKYLDESLKNCFTFEGNLAAKKVNIWLPKEPTKNTFVSSWAYIITVDLVWGNSPTEIVHPLFPDKRLKNGNYLVPQSELIKLGKFTHKFFRPTFSQYKKLSAEQKAWVDSGGLILGKLTKTELKKIQA